MTIKPTTAHIPFADCQVYDVSTIEEFLNKYYRPERYRGRGKEYAEVVLQSHINHLREYGFDIISRHESVTGNVVSFYPPEKRPPSPTHA